MVLHDTQAERSAAKYAEAIKAIRRAGVLMFLHACPADQMTALAEVTQDRELVQIGVKVIRHPEIIGLRKGAPWERDAAWSQLIDVLVDTGTPQRPIARAGRRRKLSPRF